MASPRATEVKVGLLIIAALALLAGFVLVMGGLSFEPTYSLLVGFDNPGGLQQGAPVKIAGVKVGRVSEMRFNTDAAQDATTRALVVADLAIEERHKARIFDNAVFYITTQGVLGEQFLAIDPGSSDRPLLGDVVVRGLDPPRLDRLVAESYDLLHTTVTALRQHRPEIGELFDGLTKTLKGTGTFFERNQDRLDQVASNLELASAEGAQTIAAARSKYVDNPAIDRILNNLDRVSTSSARDLPPLLASGRRTLARSEKLVNTLARDEQLARLDKLLKDLAAAARHGRQAAADAQAISGHVRRGRGSVGAMVMDEQLFDDLQELARDLKHNPWKFFWKE